MKVKNLRSPLLDLPKLVHTDDVKRNGHEKFALTFQPGSAVFIPKCDRPIRSGCTERAMLLMEAIGRSRSNQRQIKEPCAQKRV